MLWKALYITHTYRHFVLKFWSDVTIAINIEIHSHFYFPDNNKQTNVELNIPISKFYCSQICKWENDCCLKSSEYISSYFMARTNYIVAAPAEAPVVLLYLQKLWIMKRPDIDYNKRNIPVYDMDIP